MEPTFILSSIDLLFNPGAIIQVVTTRPASGLANHIWVDYLVGGDSGDGCFADKLIAVAPLYAVAGA